ncbi:type I pantothenate kinase [Paraferrimonas sp. SM1919]|uniref:type I pantothenate kinase n=1 Tax=Paraferrimonas sp. SM1919 TaxID=2662263 RepID=UPI0013D0C352|nr:type I pantothenate kinase [Paraferrimonas sp. SM1919]
MDLNSNTFSGSYIDFRRQSWSKLRNNVPLELTSDDIASLKGINEQLSLAEVEQIYLPLSRLLNLYVGSTQQRATILNGFLGKPTNNCPYIISIAGSVSVGKSTTARIMQALLQRWPQHPKVDLVTTDGFLYPLAILKQKNILDRKGFPESYDVKQLLQFASDVKAGKPNLEVPIYSHITYDINPNEKQLIDQPDILIIEGLNVLQSHADNTEDKPKRFLSDFVDFSIFVDAEESLLKTWYIERFLKFRETAFRLPNSYFSHYASLSDSEARKTASNIWEKINGPNLRQNILPTKVRANLILEKGNDHFVSSVALRK